MGLLIYSKVSTRHSTAKFLITHGMVWPEMAFASPRMPLSERSASFDVDVSAEAAKMRRLAWTAI
jgi:hypothetical protein